MHALIKSSIFQYLKKTYRYHSLNRITMKQSTSLKENFDNYLDESGIHGFSYLHPRKHYISRLFWVGLEFIMPVISNYTIVFITFFLPLAVLLIFTVHCGMRDKGSMFLSTVFKNLIFLCSF